MLKIKRSPMWWGVLVLFGLLTLSLLALPAFAEDGSEGSMEGILITFGVVTFAWTQVQMGVINILKGLKIQGTPVLDTPGKIWLANALLGTAGLTLAATQQGIPFLAALMQAVLVVFASVGEYEFTKLTMPKNSSGTLEIQSSIEWSSPDLVPSAQESTESGENGQTQPPGA